jgi:hypothetical protein
MPFHAGSPRQWVACSWRDCSIRRQRPGCGLNAAMRSPGSGIWSMGNEGTQSRKAERPLGGVEEGPLAPVSRA